EVVHQPRVRAEVRRDARGARDAGLARPRVLGRNRTIDPLLELADGGEVLVELPAVPRAETQAELRRVVEREVEDAPPLGAAGRALRVRQTAVAEETVEDLPRVGLLREGLALGRPREVVRVGAR